MLDTASSSVVTLDIGGAAPTQGTVVFLTIEYTLSYWHAGPVCCCRGHNLDW